MDTYLTITEAARRLGLSHQRVSQLVAAGDLDAVEPIPGVRRLTAREVARFARLSRPAGRNGRAKKFGKSRRRGRNSSCVPQEETI